MSDLDYIFNTLLANTIKEYERREEQLQMAYKVKEALDKNDILIAEAGTGIGKSLAYLIPAILWLKEDRRIIISTYTKTLQNQLLSSDIPLAKSVLGSSVVANAAFGGENYLCRRRFKTLLSEGAFLPFQMDELEKLILWQKTTRTGLRSEAEEEGKISIWNDIGRGRNTCIGKLCKERPNCYYEYARRKIYSSQIIITNHHLFFANLSCGGKVLPKYNAVIFDEAHNLEDVATSYFGESVTNYTLTYLLREIKTKNISKIKPVLEATHDAEEDFFNSIKRKIISPSTRIKQPVDIKTNDLFQNLDTLAKILSNTEPGSEEEKADLINLADRVTAVKTTIKRFISLKDPHSVYWIETNKNWIALQSAPIDISDSLSSTVFNGDIPVVLCSATITTHPNDFRFIKEKVGIASGTTIYLSSPFDYKNNSILYIPKDGPDPRSDRYPEFITDETEKLIRITKGRTFLLFTSYKLMDEVYTNLLHRLPDYNLLKQGETSRDILLERFRYGKRAVLLGASTFWQGVDVPGDSLISVIITRLPFDVPTDPLEEARIESLKKEGRNAFLSYQLPKAILTLKQGFGRLIRKKTDYGMVAILDTRIRKKYYGKFFLSSIPQSKTASTIDVVRQFFTDKECSLLKG